MIAANGLGLHGRRIVGALDGADAQTGFGGNLRRDALRAMTPPVFALTFNHDILTRLNITPSVKQFRIAPDMLVPLVFGQIEPSGIAPAPVGHPSSA